MHHKDFDAIVVNRLAACQETLVPKGKEYSRNGDRLHNFKSAAKIDGTTPTRSLFGMWKKHLVSIVDIFDDLDKGIIPSQAVIKEKFGDSINYHLLAEGLIEEKRQYEIEMRAKEAMANGIDPNVLSQPYVSLLDRFLADAKKAGKRGFVNAQPANPAMDQGGWPQVLSHPCVALFCQVMDDAGTVDADIPLENNDPVLVNDGQGSIPEIRFGYIRHFKEYDAETGAIVCWADGLTSFTARGRTTRYKNWRRLTDEELKDFGGK